MTMNTVSDMTPRILCSDDGPIAIVTLFNPDKLNAINGDMWRQLKRVVDALSARTDLRCIIIRGEGEAFAAGGDIEEFRTCRPSQRFRARASAVVWKSPAPAICASRGPARSSGRRF